MNFSSSQRPAELLRVGSGGIRVTPKPRGGDWLRRDLENLKSDGFDLIVSLLTSEEDAELCLEEEASFCAELDIEFSRFPIPDRCVPTDRSGFERFAEKVHGLLSTGHRGVFHCRAGLGRAPLLACRVLMLEGCSSTNAWDLIQKHRGQTVPDTPEQRAWVSLATSQITTLEQALEALERNNISDFSSL